MDKPLRAARVTPNKLSTFRGEKISAVEGLRLTAETRSILADADRQGLRGDVRREWVKRKVAGNR